MARERVERRLAAILAADVAAYSRLIGADEAGTLERLKVLRRELFNPKIAEHRGRLVKTIGDGLLLEFGSVVDALRCAVEVQRGMAERNAGVPPNNRIEFRIGINVGDVVVEDGDIFGDGVNVAARLEGLAEPGGICVSARVQEDAAGKLDLAFEDLGDQTLKNIARPVRAYRVAAASASPTALEAPALMLPDKPSIAVLPFQNISSDPEQEVFANGMVEDITTALSKLRWFFVIARNSSFAYKGRAIGVKQVGRELGVRYVLEGSVRKGGNRLRVTAQLVEAETGNHVWAERYDRDLRDIFAVQDEITERVVAAIEPELYAAENIRSQRKPPESLDAWECVIRALSGMSQVTPEATAKAERLCRQAIAMAPNYGQAHSLLAWAILRRAQWVGDLRTVEIEVNREAQIALTLDDRDPWAYLVQANLFRRTRRFTESARAARRALELNPNSAMAHADLAISLAYRAHPDAVNNAEHALRLSPRDRNVASYASLALTIVHFRAERYPECVTWARNTIDESPAHLAGHFYLVAALAMQGEMTAAAEARDALLRLRPEFSLKWAAENLPPAGELKERLQECFRKAGVPGK